MYVKVKPKICVKLMIINCESHHCRYIFSTMVWWLSLGFKDDSVFLSVDSGMGLQPQSGFAVRAEEAGGTLERLLLLQEQKQLCGSHCGLQAVLLITLSSNALALHECMPVGADLGCYVEVRRFDATPLQAALQCVFVALLWPALLSLSLC